MCTLKPLCEQANPTAYPLPNEEQAAHLHGQGEKTVLTELPNGMKIVAAAEYPAFSDPIAPAHYNGREVFDQMLALHGKEAVRGFCLCNAFKYRSRAGKKAGNPIGQDIQKALWYEARLKELE